MGTVQTYTQNVEDLPNSGRTLLSGVLHAAGGHCRCEERSRERTQAVLCVQQLHHQHCHHLLKLLLHTRIGDSHTWSQEEAITDAIDADIDVAPSMVSADLGSGMEDAESSNARQGKFLLYWLTTTSTSTTTTFSATTTLYLSCVPSGIDACK